MSLSGQSKINEAEWVTIRDFKENEHGNTLPKYEAKFAAASDKEFVDDEVVFLKETSFYGNGDARMYHVPREVFEDISTHLP